MIIFSKLKLPYFLKNLRTLFTDCLFNEKNVDESGLVRQVFGFGAETWPNEKPVTTRHGGQADLQLPSGRDENPIFGQKTMGGPKIIGGQYQQICGVCLIIFLSRPKEIIFDSHRFSPFSLHTGSY